MQGMILPICVSCSCMHVLIKEVLIRTFISSVKQTLVDVECDSQYCMWTLYWQNCRGWCAARTRWWWRAWAGAVTTSTLLRWTTSPAQTCPQPHLWATNSPAGSRPNCSPKLVPASSQTCLRSRPRRTCSVWRSWNVSNKLYIIDFPFHPTSYIFLYVSPNLFNFWSRLSHESVLFYDFLQMW